MSTKTIRNNSCKKYSRLTYFNTRNKARSEPTPKVEKEEENKDIKDGPVVTNTPDQEANKSANSNTTSKTETSGTTPSSNKQETIKTVTTPIIPRKEYYQNCTELRKVYPRGVPSDHPAYAPKHNRDKDGWACERKLKV